MSSRNQHIPVAFSHNPFSAGSQGQYNRTTDLRAFVFKSGKHAEKKNGSVEEKIQIFTLDKCKDLELSVLLGNRITKENVMLKLGLSTFALITSTSWAYANEFAPAMEDYLHSNIMKWAQSQIIVDAIVSQNTQNSNLEESDIIALDTAWRAEVGAGQTPTIDPVISNAAAEFLRQQIDHAGGVITEVFIMDSVGLNAAASDVTSDMWQGDEAKFTKTYGLGAGSIHLGDIEFDESTQSYQGQVSVAIQHPDTGEVIGAMTVGLNAEALM